MKNILSTLELYNLNSKNVITPNKSLILHISEGYQTVENEIYNQAITSDIHIDTNNLPLINLQVHNYKYQMILLSIFKTSLVEDIYITHLINNKLEQLSLNNYYILGKMGGERVNTGEYRIDYDNVCISIDNTYTDTIFFRILFKK